MRKRCIRLGRTLYGYFMRQIGKISHKKICILLRKSNLKRETEYLLTTAQNNDIRKNYIKAKIDNTQLHYKYTLCNDKHEIVNYIIIIMSCHPHGYPTPSLATSPYRSSPLAGLLDNIPYPHRAAVCMFELVVQLLIGHMWRTMGVHHFWARPCFSSSVLHVWFV